MVWHACDLEPEEQMRRYLIIVHPARLLLHRCRPVCVMDLGGGISYDPLSDNTLGRQW